LIELQVDPTIYIAGKRCFSATQESDGTHGLTVFTGRLQTRIWALDKAGLDLMSARLQSKQQSTRLERDKVRRAFHLLVLFMP
jgi:hypothetical protein